ncbi:MAG: C-terminal binding protein [Pirellulaceae bacterium]
MRPQVIVTDFIFEPLDVEREILGDIADVVALGAWSTAELDHRVEQAKALLVYHFVSVTRDVIERMPSLKIIVRCGAGYDNVDHVFARSRGIDVANVPDYGTEDVADTAIALTLSLARGTHLLNNLCRQGTDNWTYELAVPLRRIRGRTFGVIGAGRIGTAAALRAKALGYDVVFYDPYVGDGYDKALGIRRVDSLATLLPQCDVVSCHCLLSAETRHMINCDTIQWMREGSILVNTSRGAVVDPMAVLQGIESGRLAGAGIDVLEIEPPADDLPLVQAWRDPAHPAHSRLILTPHAAFYSEEGLQDMRRKGSENVRRVLLGESPRNVVN